MHGVPGAASRTSRSRASSAIRSPLGSSTSDEGVSPHTRSRSGARKKAPTPVLPAPYGIGLDRHPRAGRRGRA